MKSSIKALTIAFVLLASFAAKAEETKIKASEFNHVKEKAHEERKPTSNGELADHSNYNKYEQQKIEKRQEKLDRWGSRMAHQE